MATVPSALAVAALVLSQAPAQPPTFRARIDLVGFRRSMTMRQPASTWKGMLAFRISVPSMVQQATAPVVL